MFHAIREFIRLALGREGSGATECTYIVMFLAIWEFVQSENFVSFPKCSHCQKQ